jgi:predicted metal-dependent phosphoesterase TrpH
MIDLHVHTTASDGQYSPTEIIQKAAEKNIKAIAITDHDTISGLKEAETEAKNHDLIFIPGVELNINFPVGEFHLLGLGFKKISDSLSNLLNFLQENRDT